MLNYQQTAGFGSPFCCYFKMLISVVGSCWCKIISIQSKTEETQCNLLKQQDMTANAHSISGGQFRASNGATQAGLKAKWLPPGTKCKTAWKCSAYCCYKIEIVKKEGDKCDLWIAEYFWHKQTSDTVIFKALWPQSEAISHWNVWYIRVLITGISNKLVVVLCSWMRNSLTLKWPRKASYPLEKEVFSAILLNVSMLMKGCFSHQLWTHQERLPAFLPTYGLESNLHQIPRRSGWDFCIWLKEERVNQLSSNENKKGFWWQGRRIDL